MSGKDKHPPLDPRRWSTNKRVAAKTETAPGALVKVADGAKKVRPGDAPATSARTVAAPLTAAEKVFRRRSEAMSAAAAINEKRQMELQAIVDADMKDGSMSFGAVRPLHYLKKFSGSRT